MKHDDHDRKNKGDVAFIYRGFPIKVEAKSLQTHSIRETASSFRGTFQCDASDRRDVILPNGSRVNTTCLVVGEFDLLAINLFGFKKQWQFAFAKNDDLPRSRSKKYSPEDREFLLSSSMPITWPLQGFFCDEPFALLDEIVDMKQKGLQATPIILEGTEDE